MTSKNQKSPPPSPFKTRKLRCHHISLSFKEIEAIFKILKKEKWDPSINAMGREFSNLPEFKKELGDKTLEEIWIWWNRPGDRVALCENEIKFEMRVRNKKEDEIFKAICTQLDKGFKNPRWVFNPNTTGILFSLSGACLLSAFLEVGNLITLLPTALTFGGLGLGHFLYLKKIPLVQISDKK